MNNPQNRQGQNPQGANGIDGVIGQIEQMDPRILETLLRLLVLKLVEDAPTEIHAAMFHGQRGPANDEVILQGLMRHQLSKHKKLFDAARRGGKQQPAQPAPTKNQPPRGAKRHPVASATPAVRAIFGDDGTNTPYSDS
jgi:hypothetical protein